MNEIPPIFLRRLNLADAPAVLQAFQANPDMARQGHVTTLDEAVAYVERILENTTTNESWAVADHSTLLGLVSVSVDEENRNGWFSYWMSQSASGQGWTSRSAATVANWALTTRGLERLELGHRANNPASGAVAVKAGFIQEGVERQKFLVNGSRIDVFTYGRLVSDPFPGIKDLPMAE